jgi:hypothetical protein
MTSKNLGNQSFYQNLIVFVRNLILFHRDKYFEAMFQLFKLSPYSPLCDSRKLSNWFSEKIFQKVKRKDYLEVLQFKTKDLQLEFNR